MKRLIFLLLRASVVVAFAAWLANQPGTARIVWHEYVIETSAAFLAFAVLVLFFVLYSVFHLVRGPERRRLRRRLERFQRGHDELTDGLIAIAAGRTVEAGRLASAARRHLGETPATLLLRAQAAQLAHDRKAANAAFKTLTESEEGAVLGYRGLIMQARREGDWNEVERLAREASQFESDMPWLDYVRFESAARRQVWGEASDRLDNLRSSRLLEPEAMKRHGAALLVAQSMQEAGQGSNALALDSAERAVRQAPAWLPAIINLAKRLGEDGDLRAQRRVVEKGWAIEPHPQLAEALRASAPDFVRFYKQLSDVCRGTENHPASLLALAEAATAADIWGEARRHASSALLASSHPPRAAYRLMAQLERREKGDEKAAAQWLAKAADAAPDPAWLCSACGGAEPDWQATCPCCGTFASFEWRQPGIGRTMATASVPLLPVWSE